MKKFLVLLATLLGAAYVVLRQQDKKARLEADLWAEAGDLTAGTTTESASTPVS